MAGRWPWTWGGLLLLAGCASAPRQPVPVAVADLPAVELRVDQAHVRIAVQVDRAGLRQVPALGLPEAVWWAARPPRDVSAAQAALVLNAAARSSCYRLARWFPLQADAPVNVRVELLALRPTGRFAAGLSAVVDAVVPGPVRLPAGLGGLAARATIETPDRPLLVMQWSRGARALAESASVSRIGDAWQLARLLGRELAAESAGQVGPRDSRTQARAALPKDQQSANRALCKARYGSDSAAGAVLRRVLPLSPAAVDAGAPAQDPDPGEEDQSPR